MGVASVLAITWWIFYSRSAPHHNHVHIFGRMALLLEKDSIYTQVDRDGVRFSIVLHCTLNSIPQSKGFYSGELIWLEDIAIWKVNK